MYIKIYFNDRPLFLCDDIDGFLEPYMHHDDTVFIDEFSTHAVNSMLHEMEQPKVHAGIFYHGNLEELKKAFWKKFTVIRAGGGLVENGHKELLMIFRRGKWDLPKGKQEGKETMEQCALREVEEETGLQGVKLKKFLITTFHTYRESGKHILKESYWYTMQHAGSPSLVPQAEEDILEAIWAGEERVNACLANTFPSITDVIGQYRGH